MTSAGGLQIYTGTYIILKEDIIAAGLESKEPEIMCERRRDCNAKVTILLVVTSRKGRTLTNVTK
jgi:hypothetical protein